MNKAFDVIANGFSSVDSFFVVGGCLLAFLTLKELDNLHVEAAAAFFDVTSVLTKERGPFFGHTTAALLLLLRASKVWSLYKQRGSSLLYYHREEDDDEGPFSGGGT